MDLKRALETQRVKLLRLLTGWIFLLGVLSVGPLALPVPRSVRTYFETWLIRAECAAQYIFQASALMQGVGGVASTKRPMLRSNHEEEGDVPSARALIRRMNALRDLLENLPRYPRRLLTVQTDAGEAFDWSTSSLSAETRDRMTTTGSVDWALARIERPPDKATCRFLLVSTNSPLFSGREGFGVV